MNDERPIEKLLRRYAKKRGDAAGVSELHPATRRLLQGEVERQYPRAAGAAAPSFFAVLKNWWPWFAGSVAIITLTGFCVWMFFGGQEKKFAVAVPVSTSAPVQLAKNEPVTVSAGEKDKSANPAVTEAIRAIESPPSASAAAEGPPQLALADAAPASDERKSDSKLGFDLAPGRAGTVSDESFALKDSRSVANAEQNRDDANRRQRITTVTLSPSDSAKATFEESASRPAASPAPEVAGEKQRLSAGKIAKSESRAARAAGDLASYPSTPPLARGGGIERERAPDYVQNFANRTPLTTRAEKAAKFETLAPVLLNFQVEQTGNRLVVIDNDGSVYRGDLVTSSAYLNEVAAKDGALKKVPEATFAESGQFKLSKENAQTYFYRVAGTNQTLQQPVVFSWNFVPTTNAGFGSQAAQVSGALPVEQQKALSAQSAMPSNSTINGRVEVNGRQIEINAVPVR